MIVAYVAGIEHRQDWIKILFQDSCGEGSFGGKFWGMPVGRVPSGRGFQDSLWEVPEETPGGGAARKKNKKLKNKHLYFLFFFGCPPSHSAAKAVIQPIWIQPSRPIQPIRPVQPAEPADPTGKKKTPTAILFWRELQKITMIMIYIYIYYKPKRIN